MSLRHSRLQRGIALMAMLAILALGASAYLIRQLNAESGGMDAVRKNRNAEVLSRAKQALIGYVAMQAANSGEDNPGALPCPEAAGYFDNPSQEGQASGTCTLPKVGRFPWRTIGTDKLVDASGEPLWYVVSPGWALTSGNTNINSNSIGRLTVDGKATTPVASPGNVNFIDHGFAAGDAVSFTTGGTLPTGITAGTTYYVIAAGLTANAFRVATVPAGPEINFTGTSSGNHNVHRNPPGTANSVVALIIAPGPAFTVAAATGCAAKTQVRPLTATTDKWQNYLECGNATAPPDASTFVTTGPTGSFNDQVLVVTVADIMPGIEAAIANRIEREIAPALKSMYNGGSWSGSTSAPRLSFAAPFADPTTSTMQGVVNGYQGLLPLSFSETIPNSQAPCVPASSPRCDSTFVAWINSPAPTFTRLSGATLISSNCSIAGTSVSCTIVTYSSIFFPATTIEFEMSGTAQNVGMTLRQLNASATMTGFNAPATISGILNDGTGAAAAGSATVKATGSATVGSGGTLLGDLICGLAGFLGLIFDCRTHTISFPISVIADHPILNSSDATYGWFLRNKWHEVTYYAVAQGFAPSGAASCTNSGTCLTATYHRNSANIVDEGKQRAILVLSGSSLTGATRPNGTLADWMEGANADGASPFETRNASAPSKRMFNDRIAVLDSNP